MGTFDRDMGKHHSEDYKLSAVRYALKTDNQVETCEVFRETLTELFSTCISCGMVKEGSQNTQTTEESVFGMITPPRTQ